jgi:hypothetical protein
VEGEKKLQEALEAEDREIAYNEWKMLRRFDEVQRELKRRSVAQRLAQARYNYEIDMENHRKVLDMMHQEFQIRQHEWEDKQEQLKFEKEKSRKSIAFRLESWRQQSMAEEMLELKKSLIAEEEAEIRRMDREAMELARIQMSEQKKLNRVTTQFSV